MCLRGGASRAAPAGTPPPSHSLPTLTFFNVRTGSLTLTHAEAHRIEGRFDITFFSLRTGGPGDPDEPVEITGSFIAVSASEGGGSSP